MKHYVRIRKDSTMEFFGEPPKGFPVKDNVRRRFSEIIPTHPALRILFIMLRRLFGERGRVSEWTRHWRCEWECKILRGPHTGARLTCRNRQLLIEWEKTVWKNERAKVMSSQQAGLN